MFINHKAFTLAEVLITLMVIGILAILTIPSMLQSWEKQQSITAFKKTRALLSNIYGISVAENGEWPTYTNYPDSSYYSELKNNAEIYLLPYVTSLINPCYKANGAGAATCKTPGLAYYPIYTLDKMLKSNGWQDPSSYPPGTNTSVIVILRDGTLIGIDFGYKQIFTDFNANKPPNVIGKDIFIFTYKNKRIEAYGEDTNITSINNFCKSSSGNSPYYCSAKIVKDGYKIEDDYPW